ncbi:MAG: arginine--tRNA ligase [Firmicutes bacterium]|nr:arginine--tRNA ligase [Bacillota bacterium]
MYVIDHVKEELTTALAQAVAKAVQEGSLPEEMREAQIQLEVPREEAHGDWATNLAMTSARIARCAPRKIAETIVQNLDTEGTFIDQVEIAGPGFINFRLRPDWLLEVVKEIEAKGEAYGRRDIGAGRKVQVEFVSANPTGPLHVGHGRGAVVGSVLSNLLEAAGFLVTREYYINDAGNQIVNFGLSLEARYFQALGQDVPVPEQGYHGEDLKELMAEVAAEKGDFYLKMDPEERRKALTELALERKLADIKRDLADFGVTFDHWFSESKLHAEGAIKATVQKLKEEGSIYESEGALWLKSTDYGDDKDRVVIRENGVPTYLAADLAYHKNKFERGFDTVINVWGADHHGYIPRMKAGVAALGYDPDRLEILIVQLVNLLRDGEPVVMSKRTGKLVTLAEVIEEVGKDAARYFFIMRSADSHLDFDLSLAAAHTEENPVFYIQYAHARISSILRQAQELGQIPRLLERKPLSDVVDLAQVNLSLLASEVERALLKKLAFWPEEVAVAALNREPHRIARYAHDLAGSFHSFYNACRVITDDPELTLARLFLVDATGIVLRSALGILGVSAPDRM